MMIPPLVLWLLTSFIVSAESIENDLQCYQCSVEDNSLCTEDDLKPCGNDQAYDVCITTVKKSIEHGYHIIKKCGLGQCSIDNDQSVSLGMNMCDRSKEEFECFSCCKGNGCNKDSAADISSNMPLLISTTFLLLFSIRVLQQA